MFDIFIHFSNIIYLLSYSVRDILWLRVFTVMGASCLIPYFATRSANLNDAIMWNLLFISINLFQIGLLLKERRPAHLTPQETMLHERMGSLLDRNQFARLVKLGEWRQGRAGTRLVTEGMPLQQFYLLGSGSATVTVGGREIARLGPGAFIGEIDLLTQERPVASVTLLENAHYLCWSDAVMTSTSPRQAPLREALQKAIAVNLACKLNIRAHRPL